MRFSKNVGFTYKYISVLVGWKVCIIERVILTIASIDQLEYQFQRFKMTKILIYGFANSTVKENIKKHSIHKNHLQLVTHYREDAHIYIIKNLMETI